MGYTYEQYLKDLQTQATQSKETALTAANTLYDQSVKNAEIQRGQAMTAADSAFERSKSTYGLTAEYLAQSGLNNSGLSDNMMRDAYAARQSGYSAAGATYADLVDAAERTKADAVLTAESAYNDRIAAIEGKALELKEQIAADFMSVVDLVDENTPKADIDRWIKYYGFSKEQAKELYTLGGMSLTDDAYYAIVGKTPDSATGGATDGATGGTTDSTTGTDGTTGTIPGGTGDNNTANNVPLVAWERTTNKIKEISDVLPNIGKEGGNSVNEIIDALNAILANGDPAAASVLADFYKQEYGVSQGQKTTVGEYLYSIGVLKPDGNGGYTIGDKQRTEVDENGNEILTGGLSNISIKKGIKLREGDNFKVTVKNTDGSNSTYKVQIGKKSTESAVLNAGANVADEGFFYYNGTLYVKKDGEVWSVEKRDIGRQVSYAEMIGKVTEGLDLSDASFEVTHSNGTSDGDNITFTDSLGNEYKVQIDKQTSDLNAIKIAEGYDMKVPFKYGGNVFVKMDDGNVYRIEARSAGTEKQKKMYENLLDAVGRYRSEEQKGSEDSTFDAEVEDQEIKNLGITADFKIGNNYTVRYGGKDYKVQYDNKFYDDLIPTAKELGVKNDGVFRKGEDLYILTTYAGEDRVFKLENRPVFGRGDYGELVKALGTKTDSSSTEPTIDTSGYKKVADVSISNTGGNDFKITYGDKTYNVQFGDVASDDIKNAADALGVKEKELFTYDGGLYVKMKNNTYKVEARPNQSTGNYASLINALGDQYGVGYSSAFTLSGVDDMKKGDDITLTDVDGKEHTVESAGLATGVTVPSGIPDSVPFVVEDKAYIKVNGKVYGIRKKNAIYTNSYKSLIEKLKASQG